MFMVGVFQSIVTVAIVGFLIYFTVVTSETMKLAGMSWDSNTGHLVLVDSSPLTEAVPSFPVKERVDPASYRTVVFVMKNDEFRQTVRLPDLWDAVGRASTHEQQES